ncbi:MAG TPA: nuclear transport factor 2 family protein [Gemmatimonadales bacterium]|nr:nuclear transport factor 2 family protein [Gemmatimonadales bacterium]
MPLRARAVILMVLMSGCVTRTVKQGQPVAVGNGRPGDAEAVVRLAIARDASGDRSADTLYTPDAIVIRNARARLAAPRFAGITSAAGGGRVTITAATAIVEGRFAWVLVDYNWVNPTERGVEGGRATFICERRGEDWKIAHAHSSQPLPWEP